MPGKTVGVAATLTKSFVTCPTVLAGVVTKNGEPVTSGKLPSLPIARTETEPGTLWLELSTVARFATNRNLPAASIDSVLGFTGTFSVFGGGTPVFITVGEFSVIRLPSCDIVPSDLIWNTAMPCVALEHWLSPLKIT